MNWTLDTEAEVCTLAPHNDALCGTTACDGCSTVVKANSEADGRREVLSRELAPFRAARARAEREGTLEEIIKFNRIAIRTNEALARYLANVRRGLPISALSDIIKIPTTETLAAFGTDYQLSRAVKWAIYWYASKMAEWAYIDLAPVAADSPLTVALFEAAANF